MDHFVLLPCILDAFGIPCISLFVDEHAAYTHLLVSQYRVLSSNHCNPPSTSWTFGNKNPPIL